MREEAEEQLWKEGKRILEEVDEAADSLDEEVSEENVEKFIRAVRRFLKFTVEKGYALIRKPGGFLRGKQRIYVLVERIDEKVEELFESFKKGERMQLVERVREIKGLLVDLYR